MTIAAIFASGVVGIADANEDPIEIENWDDLNDMRENLDGDYVLVADLDEDTDGYDAVAAATANDGNGFEPIGDPGAPFTGTIDGQGHTIADLHIDRETENHIGLFGVVDGGEISSVEIQDAQIIGHGDTFEGVGVLVGSLEAGEVTDVHTSGEVTGEGPVGGFIGYVGWGGASIYESSSEVDVSGYGPLGGFVGSNDFGASISNSHAAGNVDADGPGGGFAGVNFGTIEQSHASGDVTGFSAGGFVRSNWGTIRASSASGSVEPTASGWGISGGFAALNADTIETSIAHGTVYGGNETGGFAGQNGVGDTGGTIIQSYATGSVSDGLTEGGVVGVQEANDSRIIDSYWNIETTGQSDPVGELREGSRTYVSGLTTAEMHGADAETQMDRFNFDTIWQVDAEEYPELQPDPAKAERPAGELTGTVTDSTTGDAIEGASVNVLEGGTVVAQATTNTTGDYAIDLPAGSWSVEVIAPDYEPQTDEIAVEADEKTTHPVALTPTPDEAGFIHGTVTSAQTGSPIEDASVTAVNATDDAVATVTTDTAGEFTVELPPDTYTLSVTAGGFESITTDEVDVVDSQTTEHDIELPPEPGNIDGEVIEQADGSPVQDAQVTLVQDGDVIEDDVTDTAGTFSFDAVTPGEYDLHVQAADFEQESKSITVPPGETITPTISLVSEPGTLQGEVTTATWWTSIYGADVILLDDDEAVTATTTDGFGQYSLEAEAGTYDLEVSADHYKTATIADVDIVEGEITSEPVSLEAKADETWLVTGDVTAPLEGESIEGAELAILDEDGVVFRGISSDSGYSLEAAPGTYDLTVDAEGYASRTVTGVTIPSDNHVEVNVELYPEDSIFADMDGWGTPTDPFVITNVTELQAMAEDPNATYVLGNDIDASETANWNDGAGFEPIGNTSQVFAGVLDGQGHEISGLYIDREDDFVGLFGYIENREPDRGEVKDLVLTDVDITGEHQVGAVAGILGTYWENPSVKDSLVSGVSAAGNVSGNSNLGLLVGQNQGTIVDSHATGNVSAGSYGGGLVGVSWGEIHDSSAEVRVTVDDSTAGGLVTYNSPRPVDGGEIGGVVTGSAAMGDVTAKERAGGFVGENLGLIERSSATGAVTAESHAGGFVGHHTGEIATAYAQGDVTADSTAGGFAAQNGFVGDDVVNYGEISHAYASGSVSADESAGGIIGIQEGDESVLEYSYWDTESTGQSEPASKAEGTVTDTAGLTTADMQGDAAIQHMSAFDFDETWEVEDDQYPTLYVPEDPGILSGQVVRASDGKPVSGAIITILGQDGSEYFAGTDTDGTYAIELPPGSYLLELDEDGYEPKTIVDVDVHSSETTARDVELATIDVEIFATNPQDQDLYVSIVSPTELDSFEVQLWEDSSVIGYLDEAQFTEREIDGGYEYELDPVDVGEDGLFTVRLASIDGGDDFAIDTYVVIDEASPVVQFEADNPEDEMISISLRAAEELDGFEVEITDDATGELIETLEKADFNDLAQIGHPGEYAAYPEVDADGMYHVNLTSVENDPFLWPAVVEIATEPDEPVDQVVAASVSTDDDVDLENFELDAFYAGGLLQIQVVNETADPNDLEQRTELAGLGVDESTVFDIEIEVDGDAPRMLFGSGNVDDWDVDTTEDGTHLVSFSAQPIEINRLIDCDTWEDECVPPLGEWPEDDEATERLTAAVELAADPLTDFPDADADDLEGTILATNAQEFGFPQYLPGGDDESPSLSQYVAAPSTTEDGEPNEGFYQAYLPNDLLTAWGVESPAELTADYEASDVDVSAELVGPSIADGGDVILTLDYTYSDGDITITTTEPLSDFSVDPVDEPIIADASYELDFTAATDASGAPFDGPVVLEVDAPDDRTYTQEIMFEDGEANAAVPTGPISMEPGLHEDLGVSVQADDGVAATYDVSVATKEEADLAIDVSSIDTVVRPGDDLSIEATIENLGATEATRSVQLRDASDTERDSDEVTLGYGETTTVELTWPTESGDEGAYELTIDSGDETVTRTVSVLTGDVSYADLSVSEDEVSIGSTITVEATVSNNDDELPTAYVTPLVVDDSVVDEISGEVDADASEAVTFTVSMDHHGERNVTIADLPHETVTVTEDWTQFGLGETNRGGSDSLTGPTVAVEEDWTTAVGDGVTEPLVVGNSIFVGTADGMVYELDRKSGEVRWSEDVSAPVTTTLAAADGLLYVGTETGVEAIDIDGGDGGWTQSLDEIVGGLTVSQGTVYAGTQDNGAGSLYAFDAATGDERFSLDVDGDVHATPAVAGETIFVATVSNSGTLHAFDGQVGELSDEERELWTVVTPSEIRGAPAYHDGTVFVGTVGLDAAVHAFDADDGGSDRWTTPMPDDVYGSPAIANDTVYVGTAGGELFALDATDGSITWNYYSTGTDIVGSPVITSDTVYLSVDDTTPGKTPAVVGIDIETQTAQWYQDIPDGVATGPTVIGNSLYVADHLGQVVALGERTDGPILRIDDVSVSEGDEETDVDVTISNIGTAPDNFVVRLGCQIEGVLFDCGTIVEEIEPGEILDYRESVNALSQRGDWFMIIDARDTRTRVPGTNDRGYINGTVTDSQTGEPIEGVRVAAQRHLTDIHMGRTQDVAYTNESGYYELETWTGTFNVNFRHQEYVEKSIPYNPVLADQTTTVNASLDELIWITGDLERPDGSIADNHTISVDEMLYMHLDVVDRDISNESGEFLLGVAENTSYALVATEQNYPGRHLHYFPHNDVADLYAAMEIDLSEADPGEVVDVGTIQYPEGYNVNVTVEDAAGNPVAGANVTWRDINPDDDSFGEFHWLGTNFDGEPGETFDDPGVELPEGPAEITVETPWGESMTKELYIDGADDVEFEPEPHLDEASDFRITSVEIDEPGIAGETVTANATIENRGTLAGTQAISVSVHETAAEVTEEHTLLVGENVTIELEWESEIDDVGEQVVVAETANHTVTEPLDMIAIDQPYFFVEWEWGELVEEGEQMRIFANIRNIGEEAGTQDISMSIGGEEVDVWEDLSLESGQAEPIALDWETEIGDAGKHTVTVASNDHAPLEEISVRASDPHFTIEIEDTNSPVEAGENLTVKASVVNVGWDAGTQTLNMTGPDGTVLDELEDVTLSAGTIRHPVDIAFTWETEPGDGGVHDLTVASENEVDSTSVAVSGEDVTEITECGEIDEPGRYVLANNLTPTLSYDTPCIFITADNVDFDGQGYTLDGIETSDWDVDGGTYGVVVSQAENVTVENVRAVNWYSIGYGVRAEFSTNVEVIDVVTENNTLGVGTHNVTGFTIESVRAIDNSRYGIQAYQSQQGVIRDSVARGNAQSEGYANVWVREAPTSDIVVDNVTATAAGTDGDGIRVGEAATNVTVRNSVANANDGAGFWIASGDASLHDSVAHDNAEWAITTDRANGAIIESLDIGHSTAPDSVVSFEAANVSLRAAAAPPYNTKAESIGRYFEADIAEDATDGWLDVAVHYDDSDVNAVDENSLGLWHLEDDEWTEIPDSTVDTETGTVNATITEFSTFGVFGEELEPAIEIEDWVDLDEIRYAPEERYVLVTDLDETTPGYDFIASASANDGYGFEPIDFEGSFDGNGHEIHGLVINRTEYVAGEVDNHDVGLFTILGEDTEVTDVHLREVDITGYEWVGAIAGSNWGGQITDVSVTGTINATNGQVGGIAGEQDGGLIDGAHVNARISGDFEVGGVVGDHPNGVIREASVSGNVTGGWGGAGGIAGWNYGEIIRSYVNATVTAEGGAGGIASRNSMSIVESYSHATVSSEANAGGIAATNDGDAEIAETYVAGQVSGEEYVGAIVGENVGVDWEGNINFGAVSDSYWDEVVTDQPDAVGNGTEGLSGEVLGLSTAEMTGPEASENMDALDFDELWIVEGDAYPRLAFAPAVEPAQPFVAVTIVETNAPIVEGENLAVTAMIENTGESAVEQAITLRSGEDEFDSTSRVLDAGDEETITLVWETAPGEAGEYTLVVASADDSEEVTAIVDIAEADLGDYTDEDGVVETDGLSDAVEDWQADDIDTQLLRDVVDHWRSGEPVDTELVSFDVEPVSDPIMHGNPLELSITNAVDADGELLDSTEVLMGERPGAETFTVVVSFESGDATVEAIPGDETTDIAAGDYSDLSVWREDDESVNDSFAITIEAASDEPIEIENWYDLDAVRDLPDAEYVLVTDLNETTPGYDDIASATANDGAGFDPISSFNGSFDGHGHAISELRIEDGSGLFASTTGNAAISQVILSNVTVSSDDTSVGALVGFNRGLINQSHTTGIVTGRAMLGGVAGENFGEVRNVSSRATIQWNGDDTWAGESGYGGIVGYNEGTVTHAYATGEVSETGSHGGVIGTNEMGETDGLYWDIEASGVDQSAAGTGLTTDEMTGEAAPEHMGTFDFEETWMPVTETHESAYKDSYPVLQGLAAEPQLPQAAVAAVIDDGTGTSDDPFVITDVEELQAIELTLDAHYALGTDIEASETEDWNNGAGFNSISSFDGTLDGQGYVISDLSMVGSGLFSSTTDDAVITQVALTNATVSGDTSVGTLVGFHRGLITESHTSGYVTARARLGGVVGENSGEIRNVSSHTTVEWNGDETWAGEHGYGGIVGDNEGGIVTHSVATGAVSGESDEGGIIGYAGSGGAADSYWDVERSGVDESAGGGTGLTTDEMTGEDALAYMDALDFDETWHVVTEQHEASYTDGYPILRSLDASVQTPTADVAKVIDDGEGTTNDPFVITDVHELQAIELTPDANYVLGEDIDASETDSWNDGAGFEPIGSFEGTFDGQGHVISDLWIEGGWATGLFGSTNSEAIITQVVLDNATVSSDTSVGTLVGFHRGLITESHTSGYVTARARLGGVVGENSGEIRNVSSHTTVEWNGDETLAGEHGYGGIVGDNEGGIVTHSFATGAVSGESDEGGIIGHLGTGVAADSYWDVESSGVDESAGGGTGLTTDEMTGEDALAYMDALDFDETWHVVTEQHEASYTDGYPILRSLDKSVQTPTAEVAQVIDAGEGTSVNPFVITDVHELQAIELTPDANYVLGNDIDASETDSWNDGAGFDSINHFERTFDGQGHVISDLWIEDGSGLFATTTEHAVITQVVLEDATVTSDGTSVGILVGLNRGQVTETHTTGTVTGHSMLGGVAGENTGEIRNVSSHAVVEWNGNDPVTGWEGYGGIVGSNEGGTVMHAFATGEVSDTGSTGGVVGVNEGGMVKNTYWDMESSGVDESAGGTGLITDEMTGDDALTHMDALDFDTVWSTTDQYPILALQ